jgi:hypothetical protein
MLLFKPFKDKSVEKGWYPAASITTDGVSMSVMYEKTVLVPVTQASMEPKKKGKAKVVKSPLEPCDDYDASANTMVGDYLVLGVDPGRVQLVTIVCIDQKGKKNVWSLSRGQYYTEGKIISENRKQARRYAVLKPRFAELAQNGGSLRASSSEEIRRYLASYATFEKEWWSVAFQRAESRAKMQRYIAKKSVIAKFFSKVQKEAKALLAPGQKLDVAWGAAGVNMASTGKGEAAVPTGGVYKVAQRMFGKDPDTGKDIVTPECEDYTTQVNWDTGTKYEKVFKKYSTAGVWSRRVEFLHHTPLKWAPKVSPFFESTIESVNNANSLKAKRRRGGDADASPYDNDGWKGAVANIREERASLPDVSWTAILPRNKHVLQP